MRDFPTGSLLVIERLVNIDEKKPHITRFPLQKKNKQYISNYFKFIQKMQNKYRLMASKQQKYISIGKNVTNQD